MPGLLEADAQAHGEMRTAEQPFHRDVIQAISKMIGNGDETRNSVQLAERIAGLISSIPLVGAPQSMSRGAEDIHHGYLSGDPARMVSGGLGMAGAGMGAYGAAGAVKPSVGSLGTAGGQMRAAVPAAAEMTSAAPAAVAAPAHPGLLARVGENPIVQGATAFGLGSTVANSTEKIGDAMSYAKDAVMAPLSKAYHHVMDPDYDYHQQLHNTMLNRRAAEKNSLEHFNAGSDSYRSGHKPENSIARVAMAITRRLREEDPQTDQRLYEASHKDVPYPGTGYPDHKAASKEALAAEIMAALAMKNRSMNAGSVLPDSAAGDARRIGWTSAMGKLGR